MLDVGCGTGEHALFFAAAGMEVTGIDASAIAIAIAEDRARERNLKVTFSTGDATETRRHPRRQLRHRYGQRFLARLVR